jgi:hypothetical protein
MNSGRQPPKSSGAAHHGTGPFSLATAATTSGHDSGSTVADCRDPRPWPSQHAAATTARAADEQNRLALRETAGTLHNALQGRM